MLFMQKYRSINILIISHIIYQILGAFSAERALLVLPLFINFTVNTYVLLLRNILNARLLLVMSCELKFVCFRLSTNGIKENKNHILKKSVKSGWFGATCTGTLAAIIASRNLKMNVY